jgi:RecB family exonuclease
LTIAIGLKQNNGVNAHLVERLAAERQADYRREARAAALEAVARGGRLSLAIAGALRGVADRIDGGRAKRLGAARALD